MNRSEWMQIVARMRTNWPQAQLPDSSLAKYYDDLKDFDTTVVLAAVESIYRQGDNWPPNGGMILREIGAQTVDAPEFGEAWRLVVFAVSAYGSSNRSRVLEYLDRKHPAVAMLASEIGVRTIGLSEPGDTTLIAQARDRYRALVARQTRQVTHHGLPPAVARDLRPISAAVRELTEGGAA